MPLDIDKEQTLDLIDHGISIYHDHGCDGKARDFLLEGFINEELEKGRCAIRHQKPEVVEDLKSWVRKFLEDPKFEEPIYISGTEFCICSGRERFIVAGRNKEYTISKLTERGGEMANFNQVYIEEDNCLEGENTLSHFSYSRNSYSVLATYHALETIMCVMGLYFSSQWRRDL